MAIELICRGCAKKLRVGDESAGKVARCPECGGLNPVSADAAAASMPAASMPAAASSSGGWLVRADNGHVYGPISRGELETWVQQGRVSGTFQIAPEGAAQWRSAVELFPQLAQGWSGGTGNPWSGPPSGPASGMGAAYPAPVNPYAASTLGGGVYGAGSGYSRSHRGPMVLALGILSWVFCFVFGGVAFFLGLSDVREMRAGRMDPAGMGMTQAGMYIGLAHVVLSLAAFAFIVLMMIIDGM